MFAPSVRRSLPRAMQSTAIRSASTNPPPQPSPAAFDPATTAPTVEQKKKVYVSYNEPAFKLGKQRSNAYDLVSQVPPIEVDKEMAVCDGGGGALGHPIEYISLARPGSVETCKYCALRFTQKKKDH